MRFYNKEAAMRVIYLLILLKVAPNNPKLTWCIYEYWVYSLLEDKSK